MDVTNPGLVNVADQAYGNPSTAVQSLAIPEDSDALIPVADEGYPLAKDVTFAEDGGTSTFPTPATSNVASQSPASPPLSLAQLPGVPPTFAPFPQTNIVNTVDGQPTSQNQIQPPEFLVIGTSETIQANQTDDTRRLYTVTKVIDADTGGPVIVPIPPVAGNFVGIYNAGSYITVLADSSFDPHIVDGVIVALASANPAYNFPQTVLNLQSMTGLFNYVSKGNPSGTISTFSSLSPFPVTLTANQPILIKLSSVAGYNGPQVIQNVISLNGSFDAVYSAGPGQITVVSQSTPLPAGLTAGNLVWLDGSYLAAHPQPASKIINDSDTINTITNAGGPSIRITSAHALPADIANGQMVTISGTVNYNGTYAISNVTGGTFDIAIPWVANESVGAWTAYTFNLPISYTTTYSSTWSCNTLDINVAYAGTATATWLSYTFQLQGTYSGTATGTFTYTPPFAKTTRYRIFVDPQDLQSFGVSMLGREIVFSDDTLQIPNQGATRFIEFYANNYIVIDKNKVEDQENPILATPLVGDTFDLNVQRQGAETTSETFGTSTDVTIFPVPLASPTYSPTVNVATGIQDATGEKTVDVTIGPQPGAPVIAGGVQVPTAINVNVADQSTSVGLPTNVYI